MSKRLLIASLLCLGVSVAAVAPTAAASIPVPRIKPAPPALSNHLSDQDARTLRRGLQAASRGDWAAVASARARINDPIAKDLLIWLRAARDPNASISDLTYVVHSLDDWPRMVSIQSKAEKKLFDKPPSAIDALGWFRGKEPVSGEGRIVLARAYFAQGNTSDGTLWLKSAWRDSRLTRDRQRTVFGEFKRYLDKADHAARADHLIWLGSSHFSKAQALLPHMGAQDKAVMNARMQLARRSGSVNSAVDAVPSRAQDDPGFLYERARWRRRKKSKDYALPIYLQMVTAPTSEDGRKRAWREKKIMAYWTIAEERPADTYRLATNHGMNRGSGFAEAEFLAGWTALQKLGQAEKALEHFERLRGGVSTPISLARAHYWEGRAHEKLGNGRADGAYRLAAQYPNTYYGMLASERLGGRLAQVSLPPQIVTPDAKARFDADTRVRALRLLGEAGEERLYSTFAFHLDDELASLEELALLSEASADYGFMRPSIRAAKQASRFQSMLTDSGYPRVAPIEALDPNDFDINFVYAIARQESEFAAGAVSSAKAYGMMQMINATARTTARRHRVPYDRGRLIHDRDYSARLGALHLHDLLERFDGSYVLAAVGYNAGPHRAKQWIEAYGDPRTGEVDVIDWVESIPFSETRNYVMRVLENMQVYRARRNNDTAPNQIMDDLRFGSNHPALNIR